MIGFHQDAMADAHQADEGPETNKLEKKELYEMVNATYMLPPYQSRGVTRLYLLQVHRGQVYRVDHMSYKRFEIGVTKIQQKKIGIVNNALLVKKLNVLLADRGHNPLGFTEMEVPESGWLHKMARWIDRTNILEFFEESVEPEPALTQNTTPIHRIYRGRLLAAGWLFRNPQVRGNRRLMEELRKIHDMFRLLSSYRVNLEVLNEEVRQTNERVNELSHNLQNQLGVCSVLYTSLENDSIRPELIHSGGERLTNEQRTLLTTNMKM